jgi:hypothetical protein
MKMKGNVVIPRKPLGIKYLVIIRNIRYKNYKFVIEYNYQKQEFKCFLSNELKQKMYRVRFYRSFTFD